MKKSFTAAMIVLFLFNFTSQKPSFAYGQPDNSNKDKKPRSILEDILELPFKTSEGLVSSVFRISTAVITPTWTAQKADTIASAVSVFTKEERALRSITAV